MRRRPPATVGRFLLGSFIVVERRLRRGEAALTLVAEEEDEGTTRLVGATFGSVMVIGPLLGRWNRGLLPQWVGWAGVSMMAAGLSLRVWSAQTLGSHYTRTLRIQGDQVVIDTGPYRNIRHPGYTGTIAMCLGYGLSLTSLPATVAMVFPSLWPTTGGWIPRRPCWSGSWVSHISATGNGPTD